MSSDPVLPDVSIVIPLRDEAASLPRLVDELRGAFTGLGRFEVVCVDDGSVDDTAAQLAALAATLPWLRLVRHAAPCGKSAAIWTGVQASRAGIVATMNGDGRNDPAAVPRMVVELAEAGPGCGLVVAQRLGRHDAALRRFRSKLGNVLRNALLDDGVRDASCGLKCFPRAVFLDLPYFDGLHRYLPALIRRDGYAISLIDVADRPPWFDRPRPGLFNGVVRHLFDTFGVRWLIRRRGHVPVVTPSAAPASAPVDRLPS